MSSTSDDSTSPRRRDSRFLLIPALTFIVGLLLGGVLVWAGSDMGVGSPEDAPGAAASPAATTPGAEPGATEPTDVTVTVPSECLDAADGAQDVLALAEQAARAIGDLDAERLRSLVEEMEQLEPQIRSSANVCQERRTS